MSLVRRAIDLTFNLGTGSFGIGGFGTTKVSGLRVSARILKAGGNGMSTASIQIFGMQLNTMNKLSTLGVVATQQRRNTVMIEAGDDSSKSVVFVGTITNAWADFQNAPSVVFNVEAAAGLIEDMQTTKAISFKGSTDVANIMKQIATSANLKFENNGVNVKLASPNFPGSPRQQAKACAEHAGIEWIIDNGTLAIWPRGQSRSSAATLLSPQTGMVGYPTFTSMGIMVKSIFNKGLAFGGKITVQSQLTPANGEWIIYNLNYELDAQLPRGSWFCVMAASKAKFAVSK
jgi:hypothetical protein